MGDKAVQSCARRFMAARIVLAVVTLAGLAGPARAVPAPDDLFALYATSYYYSEHWCPASEYFCTRDTSSQSFATTLVDGAYGTQLNVSGTHQANAIGSSYSVTMGYDPGKNKDVGGGVYMFTNGMFDTYTLAGSGGPVSITLNVHLTGEMYYVGYSNTGYADARARLAVGGRNQNYSPNLAGDGNLIDPAQMLIYLDRWISTYTPYCKPAGDCAQGLVDMTGTATLTVTPDTPFEIGYALMLNGGASIVDFAHTMTIDFTLPEGYSLTSARGWTDPNLAVTGIPAPAGPVLFAVALSAMAGLRRRRAA